MSVGPSDPEEGTRCDPNADPLQCCESDEGTGGVGLCRAEMRVCSKGQYVGVRLRRLPRWFDSKSRFAGKASA